MTHDEFCQAHPTLYHASADGTWPSICALGLLPVSLLLDRVGISKEERRAIERDRRSRAIPLTVNGFTIEIRDQKPLSLSRLKSALKDATVEEWLLMLNERVFFWPSEDRLKHFLQAASYAKSVHLVIEVDTKALLDHCDERVFISSMNTGTTSPYAAPRGRSTFQLVTEYPRRRRSTVAEVSVVGGVPDVRAVAKRVYRFFDGAEIETVWHSTRSARRTFVIVPDAHRRGARALAPSENSSRDQSSARPVARRFRS